MMDAWLVLGRVATLFGVTFGVIEIIRHRHWIKQAWFVVGFVSLVIALRLALAVVETADAIRGC